MGTEAAGSSLKSYNSLLVTQRLSFCVQLEKESEKIMTILIYEGTIPVNNSSYPAWMSIESLYSEVSVDLVLADFFPLQSQLLWPVVNV